MSEIFYGSEFFLNSSVITIITGGSTQKKWGKSHYSLPHLVGFFLLHSHHRCVFTNTTSYHWQYALTYTYLSIAASSENLSS